MASKCSEHTESGGEASVSSRPASPCTQISDHAGGHKMNKGKRLIYDPTNGTSGVFFPSPSRIKQKNKPDNASCAAMVKIAESLFNPALEEKGFLLTSEDPEVGSG